MENLFFIYNGRTESRKSFYYLNSTSFSRLEAENEGEKKVTVRKAKGSPGIKVVISGAGVESTAFTLSPLSFFFLHLAFLIVSFLLFLHLLHLVVVSFVLKYNPYSYLRIFPGSVNFGTWGLLRNLEEFLSEPSELLPSWTYPPNFRVVRSTILFWSG